MEKTNSQLNCIYNPKTIENNLYNYWEHQGYFKPNSKICQENFCIMMPPPNITGSLHMGHAFQQTIMDILIRYQRMLGKNTLWQVGTDHAGIATQMVIERKIFIEEGKSRHDYDRNLFIDKIWEWKKKSGNIITHQMRRLGNSVDWSRERFTMDENFAHAVREVFICLYQENLIYRGKRLVNWDPKLRTAISDLEVEYRESKSYMWYLRYPLANGVKTADGKDYLVVATTRPETILGDTAVAVNPEDFRYNDLIGQEIILPLVGRRICIIGDKHVKVEKGTGCVKITPAHDWNDYEIGKRHGLPMINIFTFDGTIRQEAQVFNALGEVSDNYNNAIPDKYQGIERFLARKIIVSDFDQLNLLDKITPYNLTISYGDRSGVMIEPMLTDQWYMRTAPLAKVAVEAVKQGRIQFVPKQYENMYFSWMRDIQDWCISRQLWWGHRIPAWYDITNKVYVGHSEEEVRRIYHLSSELILIQDEDVLDTWFSSGLWTFSALGWPEKTDVLKTFHPTSVIVSGFDIIFFWIARMIMLTMHFIKDDNGKPQVPFHIVYITPLICDEEGKKMSKSKGNVIDPLDIIDGISLENLLAKRTGNMMQPQLKDKICQRTKKQFPNGIKPYGTDALRFTLAALTSTCRNIHWDIKRLEGYRNFCNKLWNASRFVLMNTENYDCGFKGGGKILSLVDRWILSECNNTVKIYREALNTYRFDLAAKILYDFTWNQFCDWYIELIKLILSNGSNLEQRGTRHTMISVLETLLRLAHPIIPFITETLWQRVHVLTNVSTSMDITSNQSIMLQAFPEYNTTIENIQVTKDLEWFKRVIITLRNIRSEMNILPNKLLVVLLRNADANTQSRIQRNQSFIAYISSLASITLLPSGEIGPLSIIKLIEGAELLIPITDLIDKKTEITRIEKEMNKLDLEINSIRDKLSNIDFLEHAPQEIIDKTKNRLISCKEDQVKLQEHKATVNKL